MARNTKKSSHPQRPRGNPARSAHRAPVRPAGIGDWIGGARLRTLPLAVSPVLIGAGVGALAAHTLHGVLALACLAVAVCLQIGVNFANDYSDGVRGTDAYRVGPSRLTGSGKAKPRTVLTVALVFFALAAVAGIAITVRTGYWWFLIVGAVCIVAAWFYTGGKRPYGYAGLGELFVFVFFGPVAVVGTTYVTSGRIPQEAWVGGVAAGLLACAALLANNLRDIDQDRTAGKRTLSVRIGKRWTQILFTLFVIIPFALAVLLAVFYPVAWLALLALLAGIPAILIVWTYRTPRELVTALALTSLTSLGYAVALFFAIGGAVL